MLDGTMGPGMGAAAVVRATDAMLRALGGTDASLVLPLLTMPDDPSAQLGLVDPGIQNVSLSPVVVRRLQTESTGPRRRLEFLISASVMECQLSAQGAATAQQLLDGALGILYGGEIFHIEGMATDEFGGTPYLYRVVAVE
jgi:hypothetical protein